MGRPPRRSRGRRGGRQDQPAGDRGVQEGGGRGEQDQQERRGGSLRVDSAEEDAGLHGPAAWDGPGAKGEDAPGRRPEAGRPVRRTSVRVLWERRAGGGGGDGNGRSRGRCGGDDDATAGSRCHQVGRVGPEARDDQENHEVGLDGVPGLGPGQAPRPGLLPSLLPRLPHHKLAIPAPRAGLWGWRSRRLLSGSAAEVPLDGSGPGGRGGWGRRSGPHDAA
mmetsp:Transcript_807/g.3107  ORF Transcript_807/g.3107 Transcript_807/m.3107 type:complete len:221 (+) Transcript_807:908-1570(+)